MIHFDHIVLKMRWKCWILKKIISWGNTFSSQFYHFVMTTTKQGALNGKLLFCRPLHFYENVMKMCPCVWYLFFGPLHLKIPAPKNQQWRISFGDSDVFSFGIFGLIGLQRYLVSSGSTPKQMRCQQKNNNAKQKFLLMLSNAK